MNSEQRTISFNQAASYWLTRAERRRKAGDLRGAAVLCRRAARQSAPDSENAAIYAEALKELHCPEGSNREAFSALAASPASFTLLGLIAENFSDIGMKQEAADAYSLFVARGREAKPDFDAWDYDYMIDESFDERPRRMARLKGLLSIAARRMAAGDTEGSRRALLRSCGRPYLKADPQRDVLLAEWLRVVGEEKKSRFCARRAMEHAPHSASINAIAASILLSLKKPPKELVNAALLRASLEACTQRDEIGVTTALADARAYKTLTGMLARRLREHPHSLVTCYNMSVCMLLRGRAEAASRYAHMCRELDPDDPCAEVLFAKVEKWKSSSLSPRTLERRAGKLPPYGVLDPHEADELAIKLTHDYESDVQGFALHICEDASARMRYLRLLSEGTPMPSLATIIALIPAERAQALCREALTANPQPDTLREALAALAKAEAEPPYIALVGGRIMAADPGAAPTADASFTQRRIVRLIIKAESYMHVRGFIPKALDTIHRMSARQRLKMLGISDRGWALALAMRVACEHGLRAPLVEPFERLTPELVRTLISHCRELRPERK